MKKYLFFTAFFCITILCKVELLAQTIKTPMNQSVECLYLSDPPGYVELWEDQAADWIRDHNSNAVRIGPATQTYNCHAYAWHVSDGGSYCWINKKDSYNQPNVSKYWTNDAYSTTDHFGEFVKIFYGFTADHSAITTSTYEVKSKWGTWPLYRHFRSDCPYSASNLTYYKVPIDGDNCMCTSSTKTYITKNISGASYSWSGYKLSVSGSSYSVSASSGLMNGLGYVKPQISNLPSGTTIKSKKDIWIEGPDYSDVELDVYYSTGQQAPNYGGTWLMCPNTTYHIYVDNNSSCSTSDYSWTIQSGWYKYYQYQNMISINTQSMPGGRVVVKATTCCSECGSVTILTDYLGTYWDCGYYFSMSPNPADDYVEIRAEKVESIETQNLVNEFYEIRIYNSMKVLLFQTKTKESTLRIDTKQFKNGMYFVHFIVGREIKVKQLIVNH